MECLGPWTRRYLGRLPHVRERDQWRGKSGMCYKWYVYVYINGEHAIYNT